MLNIDNNEQKNCLQNIYLFIFGLTKARITNNSEEKKRKKQLSTMMMVEQ